MGPQGLFVTQLGICWVEGPWGRGLAGGTEVGGCCPAVVMPGRVWGEVWVWLGLR